MDKQFLSPAEISESYISTGCKKAETSSYKLLILGILAGAFIAFASQGSNVAIHTIASVGLGKALAGALFATGLMLVLIAGGELFTGNALIVISCAVGRNRWSGLLKNWFYVYIGNFIGSVLIAVMIIYSGQLDLSSGLLGGFTIKIAVYKTNLSFGSALILGVLCNWLVCLAVWMAAAAKDIAGKLMAIFFPIWLFISSGFEHSIANMYYIPAGILAKSHSTWVNAALGMGVSQAKIDALNWVTMITKNLIPVTIGNITGGTVFVGFAYWLIYLKKKES
jgi:formate transporter